MASDFKDYYEILEVSTSATTEEIRRAFQKKARVLHPDVNKEADAEERFKEISEAYAVLSDPQKKARYDAQRAGNPFGSPMSAGQDPFAAGMGGWPFTGFSGFNTASAAYNPRAGSDVVINLDIGADEAKLGVTKSVSFSHYKSCDVCDGKGSHGAHSAECPFCHGTGRMNVNLDDLFGFGVINLVCPECEGTGKVVAEPCGTCIGSGRVLTTSKLEVEIPAKSHDGQTIRISGKGNAGTNGSAAGDLVVRIGVPSERLDPRQRLGFSLLGFMVPLYALTLYMSFTSLMFTTVPVAFALVLIFSPGVTGKSFGWFKNAFRAFISSALNGLLFMMFIVWLNACMFGGY